jgi:hypothetical protein
VIVDLEKVNGCCWASLYKEIRRPATILSMTSIYDTADDVSSRGIVVTPRILSRQWQPSKDQLDSRLAWRPCGGEIGIDWC